MAETGGRLPRVETRQGFMDALEDMILPGPGQDAPPGRARELKSYMLESDGGLGGEFEASGMQCRVSETGLDRVKILGVREGGKLREFFLDDADPRFPVLHTNEKSGDAARIVEKLTRETRRALDRAWLHSDMLEVLAGMPGNSFRGFAACSDRRPGSGEDGADAGDLRLSVSGSMAARMKTLVMQDPQMGRTCASMVRIARGAESCGRGYAQDEVHRDGHFALKRGKSADDHLALVQMCRERYSESVKSVEGPRADGPDLLDGGPFDFEFPNGIGDAGALISSMFGSTAPFKLWGIKSSIADGYFGVAAVDLHAGSPLDFEIADDMMRVYPGRGGCGNTILRLLANLQIYHDAKARCLQVA